MQRPPNGHSLEMCLVMAVTLVYTLWEKFNMQRQYTEKIRHLEVVLQEVQDGQTSPNDRFDQIGNALKCSRYKGRR